MSSPDESAGLILKLYELRREKRLRKAREWFAALSFRSVQDVLEAARGKDNAYFRMVTSYWEMTAALVIHGGIDGPMFHDANNEHVYVYAKLEPFLVEFRQAVGQPHYLSRLQRMIEMMPDGKERVSSMQERQRKAAAAAATAKPAKSAPATAEEPATSTGGA
jgi:hypothetical protein